LDAIKEAVLEMRVDFSRELTMGEAFSLKQEDIKLIDNNGQEYYPFGYPTSKNVKITVRSETLWQSNFTYGFLFEAESKSGNYTLYWAGYAPLDIGKPFMLPSAGERWKKKQPPVRKRGV